MPSLRRPWLHVFVAGWATSATLAFHSCRISSPSDAARSTTTLKSHPLPTVGAIDVTEHAPRNVGPWLYYDWAANCGIQTAPGFELMSEDYGVDVFAATSQDLPAESPVVCVPSEVILSGGKARTELGAGTAGAERALNLSDHALFYLFLKVLREYEAGTASPWFAWLDSLPRYFSNGASMTDFCFSCLPPYAAKQAKLDKSRLKQFQLALDEIDFLELDTKSNPDVTKWAYNVVSTRYTETEGGDYVIIPMADYFNHQGSESDVSTTFDAEGNCYVFSLRDVAAGSPLRLCAGDSTNPSQLLAKYGFLDESSSATYCKWIAEDPSPEIFEMGYPSKMLFYADTGGVSHETWDVLLYTELGKNGMYEQQRAFYQAFVADDDDTKAAYHSEYFPNTLEALQRHVSYILNELEELGTWQMTNVDTGQHPRLPLIMRHNQYMKALLERVQQNLNSLSS